MKPPRLALLLLPSALACAFDAGGVAYTKRIETNLLSAPRALAPATGKLAFRRQVTILQVQGLWLRVSAGAASGWVFTGNLAATMPAEIKGSDGMPVSASETTASAAARPLAPAADDYANRKDLGAAKADLDWMLEQCKAITPQQVEDYMRANHKGEYQ